MPRTLTWIACLLCCSTALGQGEKAPLPPLPAPQAVPHPGPDTGQPYVPQAILPGGIVVPLFAPGSPHLKADKVHIPEVYNMSRDVPGRISNVVSVHNPSIEVHPVDRGSSSGTAIILVPGGGHRVLGVSGEGADFVPFLANYGITTIILRNRLRADGYVAEVDAVHDAQQAVRVVRAYAKEWGIDPRRIGIMGFSAGAELAAPAALLYDDWDKSNAEASDPFAGVSSRPDFVGIIYPGPTPFARDRTPPPIPKDVPPAFLACPSAGDQIHAVWALDYYQAMLYAGVPNVELHLYGHGQHGGGMTDRGGIPLGTWQARFIDWARDLGFLSKPGTETKAARDVAAFVANPPRPYSPRGGSRPNAPSGSIKPGNPSATTPSGSPPAPAPSESIKPGSPNP